MDPTRNPNSNTNTKVFYHTQYENDTVSADDSNDREPMFEKPLTPSDVGKLNRLVIPKQQAEKYFPLGGAAGTLLGFEDEAGKCWWFRYSYWNSSQSYVLTKGWSRYVKDKRLDAGDVVFFQRYRFVPQRLFIGWRRRGAAPGEQPQGQGPGFPPYHAAAGICAGAAPATQEQEATSGSSKLNSRRLVRLFGVNMECQLDNSSSQTTSCQCSFSSTHQQLLLQQQHSYQHNNFDYNHPHSSNNHSQHHTDNRLG